MTIPASVLILERGGPSLADLLAAVRAEPAGGARPCLVLIDTSVESGGPAEAVRRLKEARPDVRCIALSSGGGDAAEVQAMLAAGAAGCLERDLASVLLGEVTQPLEGASSNGDDPAERVARAIDERRFRMVFQPIVELQGGNVVGLEALARFESGSPDGWLRDAAAAGLRPRLELELLREALAHSGRLPAGAFLSVNISPEAATWGDLADAIPDALLGRLVVEITDHSVVDDYPALAEALTPLRRRGLRVAVDDSGQGLSSFEGVARLSPSFVKLNRTLTRDIDRDSTRRALAFALTSIATQLDAAVIAEGIETAGELQVLRSLGVAIGQGYLIGRPEALPEVPRRVLALPDGAAPAVPPLVLPERAARTFRDASLAAFRLLERELPGSGFFVSRLDHRERRFQVVEVSEALTEALEPGWSCRIGETPCHRMVAGRGPRLCNHAAADPVYGSLPFRERLSIESYVGVPLEPPRGSRLGTLCAVARERDRYDERALAMLQALAPMLVRALENEADDAGAASPARHLKSLASSDRLTGVLNRPALLDQISRRLEGGRDRDSTTYLLYLETDSVEAIAERYGRAVADLVQKDIAEALSSAAEPADVVGRLDGGRFAAILLKRATAETASYFRSLVGTRLEAAFKKRRISVGVRAGVALLAGAEPSDALDAARERSKALF